MADLHRHSDLGVDVECSKGRWTGRCCRRGGRVVFPQVRPGQLLHHADPRHEPSHPPPLDITTAAIHRATGASLGSVCLGAGIVAIARVVGRSAAELRRITAPRSNILPAPLSFLSGLTPVFTVIAGVLDQLNGYALVYVGITGDAFWPSARRAVGLVGRRKGGRLLDCESRHAILTDHRHPHQTATHSELHCHGLVHWDRGVLIHEPFIGQPKLRTRGGSPLRRCTIPGYPSWSGGSDGCVSVSVISER